jgi:hypothetical protein
MAQDNICRIHGCSKPIQARSLCGAHYQRWYHNGDTMDGIPIGSLTNSKPKSISACKIDGCDRPVDALSLCHLHYNRQRRHGDPGSACIKRRTIPGTRQKDHPLYNLWKYMVRRCHNPSDSKYHKYGQRGIKVCDRWRYNFWNFAADVGQRPSPKHSIDRYPDFKGDYSPDNFRWATQAEQARNTRVNRYITAFGRTQILQDWATEAGIHASTIDTRLKQGWTSEEAIGTLTVQIQRQL